MDDIEQHVAPAAEERPPEVEEQQFAPQAGEEDIQQEGDQQQQQQAENQPPQDLQLEEVSEDDPRQQQQVENQPPRDLQIEEVSEGDPQQQQQADNQPLPTSVLIEEVDEDEDDFPVNFPPPRVPETAPELVVNIFNEMFEAARRIRPRTENMRRLPRDAWQPGPPRLIGRLLKDEEDNNYKPVELIGTAERGAIQVYRSLYFAKDFEVLETLPVDNLFVAAKTIKSHQESEALTELTQRIEKNSRVPDHPNVLGIEKSFTYQDQFCVIFPLMDFGSLRSLMMTSFPDGFPEDCITIALKEALKGLQFLHENGQVHNEISAGHIYLSQVPEIKLGFSASIYNHGSHDQGQSSSSSSLPMALIFNWAAAPEVYDNLLIERLRTAKSDIWLIGITALELAYGTQAKFQNRDELDAILEMIRRTKKLPRKEDGGNQSETSSTSSDKVNLTALVANLIPSCFQIRARFTKPSSFSKRFDKLVLKCVNVDPAKRPTAQELLMSKVFAEMNRDVGYFLDVVRNPRRTGSL